MSPCKLSKQFGTFYRKGPLFQKTQKLLTKFPGLATSNRHNYTMVTDRRKFTTKRSRTQCIVSLFTVRINSTSFPWDVGSEQETYFPHFRQRPMSDVRRWSCLAADMERGRKADWIGNWISVTQQITLASLSRRHVTLNIVESRK